MGWINALVQTYDACSGNLDYLLDPVPLLPICHTMNLVQIEVTLDSEGKFCRAEALQKDKQNTILPCLEQSRGNGLSPHPLVDKLQYLAKDYSERLPTDSKKAKSGFDLYLKLLNSWCQSDYSNPKIVAVKNYVESGRLIQDLISGGILISGSNGRLSSKIDAPHAPMFVTSKISGEQYDAFVRWRVEIHGDPEKDTWKDESLHQSWIDYYVSTKQTWGFCYVAGEEKALENKHPVNIRRPGDRAKIISSNKNGENDYVFRGRFKTAEQACGIGFEATQKAHNALRWLISRQGCCEGELCVVSWTPSGKTVSNPIDDSSWLFDIGKTNTPLTGVGAAHHLNNRIRGYNSKILDEEVMIMEIGAATPGRLSVLMYRECLGEDLVKRLERWHLSCAWKHNYASKKNAEGKVEKICFIGAPSPRDIAKAAYGEEIDSKMVAYTVKRILPCILDGGNVPKDIVDAVVRRASNPAPLYNKKKEEWLKALSIACSVYKQWSGGKYEMVLERERKTRDYLYGRLLAVADLLEGSALMIAKEKRQTTAVRMMQRFSEFPYSTWKDIEVALVPYMARLGTISKYYEREINDIMSLFDTEDFTNNSKLSGEFLLAYHCQKEDHFNKNKENDKEMEE